MSDPLLWVLPHFITHYAGQTTQGDTNDGDAVDKVSGSNDAPKQDTDLPQRVHPLRLKRPLQESSTHDQNDASSSADLQPDEECKGGYWLRKTSKSCPQQQSLPESQSSTLHDPPQSDEIPLLARVGRFKIKSYIQSWGTDWYREFIASKTRYFQSEYSLLGELGQGHHGMICLAARKSDGKKIAYKSIPKSKLREYASESTPPPRCHIPNPLVLSDEQPTKQCTPSRPPNLMLPYEFMMQMYLSQPGHENPYVPIVLDYIILKDKYILIMEYCDEKWMDLSKYVKEKGPLDIETARDIIKEVVNAMISLKQHDIVHEDIHASNVMYNTETSKIKLIDFNVTNVLPGWKEGKSLPLKSSEPPSLVSGYKAGYDELQSIWMLGKLLYNIMPVMDIKLDHSNDEQAIMGNAPDEFDPSKSRLKEKATQLIDVLLSSDSDRIASIEAILTDSFFN
ncbi:hypothetical protein BASA50_003745 [Batrachochytrium salamandrivorans]|uniref:non-specific serine/threonine protein kinase n=1 Tax=Batrachochytrium salamandrivorans TaxID=1357716 RepID=A0ABQ8FIC2_9FUNG|nr:hypothetical protein BASA50_003745 [Batrachochytrium salamandrivorans]